MVEVKILITGKNVHDVGYRTYLLLKALDYQMKGFDARNITKEGMQVVEVLVEGKKDRVNEFYEFVSNYKENKPENARVSNVERMKHYGKVKLIEKYIPEATVKELYKGINAVEDLGYGMKEVRKELGGIGGKIDGLGDSLGGKIDNLGETLSGKIIDTFLNRIDEIKKALK